MIERDLYDALSGLGYQVYPVEIPQDQELPVISYRRILTMPTNSTKGTNRSVDNAIFMIDIRAGNYFDVKDMAEAAIDIITETYGAKALLRNNRDESDAPGVYHVVLEFSLREIREGGS